jgi:hypothetical protein
MGRPRSVGLITRRSQVQILPPLLRKAPETVPLASLWALRAFTTLPDSARGSRVSPSLARGMPTSAPHFAPFTEIKVCA